MSTTDLSETALASTGALLSPRTTPMRAHQAVAHTSLWRRLVLAVFAVVVRGSAPLTWRTRARAALKLRGFAATEQGSAKDMLRAAWLSEVPAHRRLFFVHALDEMRHADLFRAAARDLLPTVRQDGRTEGELLTSARMQNLYARKDARAFLAFVEDAEERGLAHFTGLAQHFARAARHEASVRGTSALTDDERASLSTLFARVADDERFHVQYSGRLLARTVDDTSTLANKVGARAAAFAHAWRRSGRTLGDRFVHAALWVFVVTVFPLFALLAWRDRAMRAVLRDARAEESARGVSPCGLSLDDERALLTRQDG